MENGAEKRVEREREERERFCVTGATGYIGSWLVNSLLQRGYIVHATLRDPGFSLSFFLTLLFICFLFYLLDCKMLENKINKHNPCDFNSIIRIPTYDDFFFLWNN